MHMFVGPPDPVSNLRPVMHSGATKHKSTGLTGKRHPYSLDEFRGGTFAYQLRIEKQSIDDFNHAFWTDVRVSSVSLF